MGSHYCGIATRTYSTLKGSSRLESLTFMMVSYNKSACTSSHFSIFFSYKIRQLFSLLSSILFYF